MPTLLFLFGSAFVVGLSGAMMPGPVLAATIGETLRRGALAGPLVALGHALLEIVVLAGVVFGLANVLTRPSVLGALGLGGGMVLVAMGALTALKARAAAARFSLEPVKTGAMPGRGPVAAGFLLSLANPYWFLWWATVGLNYAATALQRGLPGLSAFYSGHILADAAWLSVVSLAVAAGRRACPAWLYRAVLVACGLALCALGAYFFGNGVALTFSGGAA